MDWSNERYVRIYVRDTKTWKLLGWEGQAVLCLLARRFDRSGLLDDVRDAEDVALMIGGGFPVEIAEVGLCKILDKGVMEIVKDGLFWPKFMSAQEASKTNAQRQREFRERRRAEAKLESVSQNVTDAKQNVTKSNAGVTAHNELSQPVTPTSAVPSCAVSSTVVDDSRPPRDKVSSQEKLLPPLRSSDLTSGTKTRSKSSKSGPVWESYSTAYAKRYGVTPQRNARISGQLCTLIDYIGAELAPKVAAYFLTSNNQWYVKNAHPVDSLLRDCQKLRTEYLTGNRITATQAHEADRIQATGDSWDRVMAKREERRRNGE